MAWNSVIQRPFDETTTGSGTTAANRDRWVSKGYVASKDRWGSKGHVASKDHVDYKASRDYLPLTKPLNKIPPWARRLALVKNRTNHTP